MKWLATLALLVACTAPITPKQVAQYVYYFPTASKAQAAKTDALKGIANVTNCDDVLAIDGAGWQYTWYPDAMQCAGMDNVPMIRDGDQWARIKRGELRVSENDKLMLANEPDICPEQGCLSPDEAAMMQAEVEVMFPNWELISPAPSHLHPEWYGQFIDAFKTRYNRLPRLDALAAHCYLWTAAECIAYVERIKGLAKQWGIGEIWVTEFCYSPGETRSLSDAGHEATKFIDWLKRDPMVTRYAYFTSRSSAKWEWVGDKYWMACPGLLDAESGKPSYFGLLYAGF